MIGAGASRQRGDIVAYGERLPHTGPGANIRKSERKDHPETWNKYFSSGDEKRNILTEFNSNNTHILNVEETKAKIAALAYIQEELAKWEK